MKKIELGQAVSILANLGVIAGIVFLALELQQNNALLAAQARSELATRRVGFVELVTGNGELADIIVRANAGEPLSPAEQFRFRQLGRRLLSSWASQYREIEEGAISQDSLPILQWRALYHGTSDPDYQLEKAWAIYRLESTPGFVAFMERAIVEPGPPYAEAASSR